MARKPSARRALAERRRPASAQQGRGIVNPDGKDIVLAGVRSNAGVASKYRARLDVLIRDMQEDIVRELLGAYREKTPELADLMREPFAQDIAPVARLKSGAASLADTMRHADEYRAARAAYDASPARTLGAIVRRLTAKWQGKFDAAAPDLAAYFATAATERAQGALKGIFRKAGWTVQFDPTRASNDVFQATLAENVGLIRSIASEHLSEVQGLVMRSVSAGRDLSTLTDDLQDRYGITRRRAKHIALDQNNKATSSIVRTRQIELGLTEAEWMHSGAGKHPRPPHVKAGKEKLRYDLRKGAYIDGKWIFPGEEINCRCVGKTVIPGF